MTAISRVHFPVTALGPGRRLGIWFQGCATACKGCMSRDTWDPAGGTRRTPAALAEVWRLALAAGADGLTVSGGEPFDQPDDLVALLTLAAGLRQQRAADLLVYTGYEFTDAIARAPQVRDLADALITGPYDVTRPTRLIWRGSANQVLHPLSPLGERRYAPYAALAPDRAPLQVGADGDRIWLIGVPPPGALPAFERGLRRRGVTLGGTTWRP